MESLQEKKSRLRHLLQKQTQGTSLPAITARPRRAELEPLSFAQEALWFVSQLEGPNAAYNNSLIARFIGALDVAALSRAVTSVVARHDALRTRFVVRDGVLSQAVTPAQDIRLQPEWVEPVAAADLYRAEARKPFDITVEPLYRVRLFAEAPERFALVLSLHHIVSDAWSVGLFLRELMTYYVGAGAALEPIAVDYLDYVHWQRDWLQGAVLDRQLGYWRGRLTDLPSAASLPPDHPRASQSNRGGTIEFAAPRPLLDRLIALGNAHRSSLFMTLLAALAVILHRHSGQEEVVLGTGVSSRRAPELDRVIGYFVNTVVVRLALTPDTPFIDVLKATREVLLEALENQDVPFHRVVEELRPQRAAAASPLFQVMVTMQSTPYERRVELPSLAIEAELPASESAKFDLSVALQQESDGLHGQIEFRSDLFDTGTVRRLADRYVRLLEAIAADPEGEVGRYDLLDGNERLLLADDWSGRARAVSPGRSVHALFEECARRTPSATALVHREAIMTYAELDAKATRLARLLRARGVSDERVVAVCLSRGFDLIVSLLGILKAGGAYLPIDPDVPLERMRYQLRDASADLLLTAPGIEVPGDAAEVLLVNRLPAAMPEAAPDAALPEHVSENALAYVMYTSGSTGQPKGVAVEHRGIARLVRGAEWMEVDAGTVTIQHSSISFDAATFEIWAPLLNGGTLVLRHGQSADVAGLIEQVAHHHVNTVWLSAGVLPLWVDRPESRQLRLRYLLAGGDVVSDRHVREVYAHDPGVVVINGYGPTENTTFSCCYPVPRDRSAGSLPIGWPITGTDAYVLDDRMQLQPLGCVGELYVGGAGVARGYVGKPALTERAFVPHPFSPDPDARLYRTGDRARWLAAGGMEFLGRADNQVKIRGFRVELDEIELHLMGLPDVHLAAVAAREDAAVGKRLVAYVVLGVGAALHDREQFISRCKGLLRTSLPEYMVPSAFVICDELPLTPNGKVDRRLLPEPADDDLHHREYRAPRDETERALCTVWEEVLHLDRVGIDDSFFELGGHSLLATRLVAYVHERVGKPLPLGELFRSPTVAAVAAYLAGVGTGIAEELPAIAADEAHRFDSFPMTGVQQAYWLGRSGVFELGNISTHAYVEVELPDVDLGRFNDAWNRLIERHGMLRAVFHDDGTQRILPSVPRYELACDDLRGLPAAEQRQHLEDTRARASHQIFDATRWPLFDLRATRLTDRLYRLHFSIDALPSDAMSSVLLVRELDRFYDDPAATLPPLAVSFRDYVLGLDRIRATPSYERSRAYWEKRVAALPPPPDLPLAKDPAAVAQPRFQRRNCMLERPQWEALQEKARAAGVTPSALLVSAYGRVLGRWSRTRHFTLTLTLFNRLGLHSDVDALVGDFTSLIPLEIDDRGGKPLRDFARDVQSRLWSDIDHRYFDGIEVLRLLNRRAGPGKPVFMPVVFTSTLGLAATDEQLGTFARALSDLSADGSFGITQTSQVWLDNVVGESQGRLTITWDALEELFPPAVLDSMFAAYRSLLEGLAAGAIDVADVSAPAVPAGQLERRRAVNATDTDVPRCLLHDLFGEQAALRPSAPAVIQGPVVLDYGELGRRANHLARELRDRRARRNELVAIVMVKGWEQVVAALGILRSGAAYLPIDAALPPERIALLLAQGEVRVAVTQGDLESPVAWPAGIAVITIDRGPLDASVDGTPLPPSPAQPDDLAYVIFTSGSTGMPKGVMIDHRGAVNTVVDINRRFGVGAGDRVLGLSSMSFDLSVYDVFGVLGAGGALILPDRSRERDTAHWVDVARRHRVTIWNTVPVLAQLFVEELLRSDDPRCDLRLVMMSGDWIPLPLPPRLNAACPGALLVSLGGATEASIWSIFHVIDRVDEAWTSIPYGQPLANQRFHVLAKDLSPSPDWVIGDLCIAGIGLARGYWRDDDKTGRSFVEHPVTGERLYRTGDVGRYWPDGTIEFLGREDTQVKVHGQRIELGEIEAALTQFDGVAAAAVTTAGDGAERRLVAYVVPAEEGAFADPAQQAAFKIGQPGLRKLPVDVPSVALAHDTLRVTPTRRPSVPDARPIALQDLGRWLGALAQTPVEGHAVPKRHYPSAGSLYPVQVYLAVGEGAVSGLQAGAYYHDPAAHRLARVGAAPSNAGGVTVLLAASRDAIEPVYGDLADDFCRLEAGHAAELLASAAPPHGIAFDAVEASDDEAMCAAFGLADRHRLLARGTASRVAAAEPSDAITLRPLERQSYREFAAQDVDLDQLRELLRTAAGGATTFYVHVKGVGFHRFDATASRLVRVADADDGLLRTAHAQANRAIHARAACSIVIAGPPEALLSAGAGGQTLMTLAPRHGLGLCPIGRFASTDRLRAALRLAPQERILYAFEGGAILSEQAAQWPVESAPSPAQQLESLRDFLRTKLPAYMVPSVFVPIERLPLNQNGKVDRKALPQVDAAPRATRYEAPRGDVERAIAAKWAELLRVERIGIFDNFFELGGDSLAATRFVSAVRNEFGRDAAPVSLESFFGGPTVSEVADRIEIARQGRLLEENSVLMAAAGDAVEEGSL